MLAIISINGDNNTYPTYAAWLLLSSNEIKHVKAIWKAEKYWCKGQSQGYALKLTSNEKTSHVVAGKEVIFSDGHPNNCETLTLPSGFKVNKSHCVYLYSQTIIFINF